MRLDCLFSSLRMRRRRVWNHDDPSGLYAENKFLALDGSGEQMDEAAMG